MIKKGAFGKNLKLLRERQGKSQRFLAKECGLTNAAISLIEAGKRNVNLLTAQRICKALDCDLKDLI